MPGIARTWRALATRQGADAYVRYFERNLRPQLAALRGFRGAVVLLGDEAGSTRIMVITQWSSLDAIREFAGDSLGRAVIEPEARALLQSFDVAVEHFEIALNAPADVS